MGMTTSAVVWFGYPMVEDVIDIEKAEGEKDAEFVFGGWYDSSVATFAVPGFVIDSNEYFGETLPATIRHVPSQEQLDRLREVALKHGMPCDSEPRWYLAPRVW